MGRRWKCAERDGRALVFSRYFWCGVRHRPSRSTSRRIWLPPRGHHLGKRAAATASLDTATKSLTWTVEYSGLSGPATAAHIHGPADPGANAGIVVPFTGNLASPIKGSATLTDAQIAQLEAGKWYVNIHTEANKGGEICGQLVRAS